MQRFDIDNSVCVSWVTGSVGGAAKLSVGEEGNEMTREGKLT